MLLICQHPSCAEKLETTNGIKQERRQDLRVWHGKRYKNPLKAQNKYILYKKTIAFCIETEHSFQRLFWSEKKQY